MRLNCFGLYVAERLDPLDLAYLHVMDGLGFGFHELGDPMRLAEEADVSDWYSPTGAEGDTDFAPYSGFGLTA